MKLFKKVGDSYEPATNHEVWQVAESNAWRALYSVSQLLKPEDSLDFLRQHFAGAEREHFSAVFLTTDHRVIAFERLFSGTIDAAAVYPREVVRASMKHNAAAIILAHNHPSGNPEPSNADRAITRRIVDACTLVDVRVLDHFVFGHDEAVSFAERSWI